jgi:hypothetical protein
VTYGEWLKKILQEGVKNGEIIEHAVALSNGLFALGQGMFISSCARGAEENLREEIENYIDTLFDLIEVKK